MKAKAKLRLQKSKKKSVRVQFDIAVSVNIINASKMLISRYFPHFFFKCTGSLDSCTLDRLCEERDNSISDCSINK